MLNPGRVPARHRPRGAASSATDEAGLRELVGSGTGFRLWNASPPSFRGYLQQLYAIVGWTSVPWLRELRARTLILSGDDDLLVPVSNARLMHSLLRDAEVHIARGGGHFWLLDNARESAAVIERFLADGRRDRAARGINGFSPEDGVTRR